MTGRDVGAETNRALLLDTVNRLGDLADEFVFVGGCATGLLVTSIRSQTVRVTIDVDVVAQVATLLDYYGIAEKLKAIGFAQTPHSDAPLCRWQANGLQLDVVPTDPSIIGFSNRWYALAAETAGAYELAPGKWIRLITAPLFLATKLEAFADRGSGDFWASHDIEDFVSVVDGRSEILDELHAAPAIVREYLRKKISDFLANSDFNLALAGHLPGDVGSQARLPILRSRIRAIADLPV